MSERVGRVAAYAYGVIMLIQLMEAFLRYALSSPTLWAWDVNAQLFMSATILGGGYVLLHDAHVRVDVLYSRVSRRKKAIFDLVSFTLAAFVLGLMTWELADMAWTSWLNKERGHSLFAPPIYPVKLAFLIGVFLLLLQTVAHVYGIIRSLNQSDSNEKRED